MTQPKIRKYKKKHCRKLIYNSTQFVSSPNKDNLLSFYDAVSKFPHKNMTLRIHKNVITNVHFIIIVNH